MTAAQKNNMHHLTKEQEKIFLTFANLLANKEEGTASHLAFLKEDCNHGQTGGLDLWADAVKIKDFPVNRESRIVSNVNIVQDFTRALQEDITERNAARKISFVEIGPGLWESVRIKTVPYIEALKDSSTPVSHYISIDPSSECAKPAAKGIKDLYPHMKTSAQVSSFEDAKVGSKNLTSVAILWGPTIWNTGISSELDPELVLASQLKSVKQVVNSGGYILSTYYSSDNREKDDISYNDPRNLKLVQSLAHSIEHRLDDTNFKADNFQPYVEYKGNGLGRYSMGIESKIDQTVNLNHSVSREFKIGERMGLVNSWRLKEQKLYNIVSTAGADMICHSYDKDIGAGMFLARFR